MRGNLFVVSAPSGAGKTTLCRKLVEELPGIEHVVSYTTRAPRQGETGGIDYTFISEDEFQRMVDEGEFLEWAFVHGNRYGTSRARLEDTLEAGRDVIIDIDTEGAGQIRESSVKGVYIFILPPSMKVLRERLLGRMSDSKEESARRLRRAAQEIKEYYRYDYVILNDDFDEALRRLYAVVFSRRALTEKIEPEWVRENFLNEEEK